MSFEFKLVLDVREALLYDKCLEYFSSLGYNYSIELRPLDLGDAIICMNDDTLVLFERKCMTDLIASIKDGRYEEQSYRLCGTSKIPRHQCIYLIEGTYSQLRKPQIERKLVNSAITSLLFFKGFSVLRTFSINETAEYLAMCIDKLAREYNKKGGKTIYTIPEIKENNVSTGMKEVIVPSDESEGRGCRENVEKSPTSQETIPIKEDEQTPYCTVVKKVKKENVTPENIGEIILCQIPGISSTNAIQIIKEFGGSLNQLIQTVKTDPTKISQIQIVNEKTGKKRKIGKNVVENIIKYLGL